MLGGRHATAASAAAHADGDAVEMHASAATHHHRRRSHKGGHDLAALAVAAADAAAAASDGSALGGGGGGAALASPADVAMRVLQLTPMPAAELRRAVDGMEASARKDAEYAIKVLVPQKLLLLRFMLRPSADAARRAALSASAPHDPDALHPNDGPAGLADLPVTTTATRRRRRSLPSHDHPTVSPRAASP
ncbi:hypothetical protein HK405_014012, partial [Cladochytrium tenue]